ncbi:hypothetical protein GCM10027449_18540 [Sinomonas notoginsengisoli]|uniref:hypothetical protein n=1 Tax=Sinomonas notoginsengisoli TaxID=1457311 RepID=UPI001F3E0618|nr:hypothetical protein [Sinomonas notoginsengisoli]
MCNDKRLAPEVLRKMPCLVQLADYAHENGLETRAVLDAAAADAAENRSAWGDGKQGDDDRPSA